MGGQSVDHRTAKGVVAGDSSRRVDSPKTHYNRQSVQWWFPLLDTSIEMLLDILEIMASHGDVSHVILMQTAVVVSTSTIITGVFSKCLAGGVRLQMN